MIFIYTYDRKYKANKLEWNYKKKKDGGEGITIYKYNDVYFSLTACLSFVY